ncbi:MAG: glycosyltransferase [Patescibacteria group bacterium]
MRIALAHDYLREYGGAERVLEALHEIYPEAPVYTAFVDKKSLGIHYKKFKKWNIKTTWMADIPFIKKLYSPLRFLAPHAFADLDLSKFDLVISSSNAYYAKAVKVRNGKHLCYCHTPPRSLYGYSTSTSWKKNIFVRIFGELINFYLRQIDFKIAQKVDVFIANSEETKRRIEKFYRRDSVVVFPPVSVKDAMDPGLRRDDSGGEYYLYVNRLALAKHPEIAVQVCNKLNLPLKVVGTGKMLNQLKEMVGNTVEILGSVDDKKLNNLYSAAKALIYPVEDEDFGMIPVEAMMHGVPVIAHASGGPLETVLDKKTGIFFEDLNFKGLEEAIKKFEKQKFDKNKIKKHAGKFSKKEFERKIKKLVLF